jgi:putative oxidoreductase
VNLLSRPARITAWVLQALGAASFLGAGIPKLMGAAPMVQLFDTIGIGQWFRYVTGGIEVGSALLLLIPPAAAFGATLLVLTMIGAIVAHVFILHSNPGSPAVLLVLVGTIVWLRRGQIVARFTARPKAIGRGMRE